ncbi:hypothetical protein [Streptomyces sp. NPDC058735]|uniref:hypothetical protein n=1 Tax=unclassified Streptomyces TaxID=2593676 RepID=UPI0036ABE147
MPHPLVEDLVLGVGLQGRVNYGGDKGVIPRGVKGTGDAVWFQKSNQWVNCR